MVLPREEREQLRTEVVEAAKLHADALAASMDARFDSEIRSLRDQRRDMLRALRRGQIVGEQATVVDAFAAALGVSPAELRSALMWVVAERRLARSSA